MDGGVKVEGTGKSLSKGIAAELKTILAAGHATRIGQDLELALLSMQAC